MRFSWRLFGSELARKAVIYGPFLVALAIVILLFMYFVPFNGTASMPYGWYVRLPAKNIQVGDLVEIDNPLRNSFGVEATGRLLKKVTAINGDLYEVRGEHLLSYDSRLFGLIGIEYIRHKVIPLATFTEVPGWIRWLIRNQNEDIKE